MKVDRIEWIIMPDPTTAANALVAGEVDFWEGASPDLLDFLRRRGMTLRRNGALPSVAFVRPNFQHEPFSDPRARMALALLVDQQEMLESFAGDGAWTTCYSFSVCGSSFATEAGSEPYRKPDVARAKALLTEAGYHGETLVLLGTPTLAPINASTLTLGPYDVVSVPVGVMRGFRNESPHEAMLLVVVGGTDPGQVDWTPSVLEAAAAKGFMRDASGNIAALPAA